MYGVFFMEIRILEYFLAVCREQTISGAASALHLTQPTLTRQLRELEDNLGVQLLIRSKKGISLTDEGMLLRKRAEEIVDLVNKTKEELLSNDDNLSGDIFIGTGESDTLSCIIEIAKEFQDTYPNIKFNIDSGDYIDVLYKLDQGLIDFGVIFGKVDKEKYNYITLPIKNHWGLVVKKNEELAKKEYVTFDDIKDLPLIVSRQSYKNNELKEIFKNQKNINIVNTHNLVFNAIIMQRKNMGYIFTLNKIINENDKDLKFIPYYPLHEIEINLIWKKYQFFSKPSKKFLDKIKDLTKD